MNFPFFLFISQNSHSFHINSFHKFTFFIADPFCGSEGFLSGAILKPEIEALSLSAKEKINVQQENQD